MKKRFLLLTLLTILALSFGFASNKTEAAEDTSYSDLKTLLSNYYGDGTYKKDTEIFVNLSEVNNELGKYFHANVAGLVRTTYYTKDALWMSRGEEVEGVEYSYYGTAEGNTGVTNATATTPLVAPETARVALKGEHQNSMEEYYVTLNDFIEGSHISAHSNNETLDLATGWEVVDGVYTNTSDNVFDGFRLFTAPLWLGKTSENKNYVTYEEATIEEVGSKLVMKLWVSSTDEGKLSETETKEVGEYTYYVFSKAVITKKGYSDNMQGALSENLQEGYGTDFDGYDPVKNSKLFVAPGKTISTGWHTDSNGVNAIGIQSGYQAATLALDPDDSTNPVLRLRGSKIVVRVALNVNAEITNPGTYKASIKVKLGTENSTDISQLLLRVNKKTDISANGAISDSIFFSDSDDTDSILSVSEWTTLNAEFTVTDALSKKYSAQEICLVFVVYTNNDTNNLGAANNFIYIDELELYKVKYESQGTDFEGYNPADNADLFDKYSDIASGIKDTNAAHYKWFTDNENRNIFALQYNYTDLRLHEEDGNVVLKATKGNGNLTRVGINVNDEISNPGVYKATIRVKTGPEANKIGNILFRFQDSKHLYASGGLAYPKSGIYFREVPEGEESEFSKGEWTTLEVEFVVSEKINYKNDLIIVLMIKNYNSDNNPENYVLVDDLTISKVVFE